MAMNAQSKNMLEVKFNGPFDQGWSLMEIDNLGTILWH